MPSFVVASEVVLKTGQVLEGKIIEQTDQYIRIDAGIGMSVTFYSDEIDTVDGRKLQALALLPPFSSLDQAADITQRYAQTIIALSDSNTGIPPSHYGSPGYEDLTFVYDASISAMLLKQAGKQKEAEKIIDYFVDKLRTPLFDVRRNRDGNGIIGILKLSGNSLGLVNAIDPDLNKKSGARPAGIL